MKKEAHKILSCVLLALTLPLDGSGAGPANPLPHDTLGDWRQKINRTVDSSKEAIMATGFFDVQAAAPGPYTLRSYANPLITLDDFEHKIAEYIQRNPITSPSGKFVQELVSRKEQGPATYYFFGDFHGDIRALVLSLERLAQLGIIGDDFGIKDPKSTLIFLGDYVDRGLYGAEVHYLLMTLKIKNSERVVLLRGNHEEESLNNLAPATLHGGYSAELSMKFFPQQAGKEPLSDERSAASMRLGALKNRIFAQLYPTFPIAVYLGRLLGAEGAQSGSYVLCCHGGLDVGMVPVLKGFDRKVLLPPMKSIVNERKRLFTQFAAHVQKNGDDVASFIQDIDALSNDQHLGYQWSDFNFTDKQTRFNSRRGAVIGLPFLKVFLTATNKNATRQLNLIIRGHQHSPTSPVTEKDNHGMYVAFNGLVTTLCSTKFFTNNQASFLQVTIDDLDYRSWLPTLHYLEEMNGQWQSRPSTFTAPSTASVQ